MCFTFLKDYNIPLKLLSVYYTSISNFTWNVFYSIVFSMVIFFARCIMCATGRLMSEREPQGRASALVAWRTTVTVN